MNSLRSLLCFALLFSFASVATAQTASQTASTSDAQKSFDNLKSLAGTWKGALTVTPPQPDMDAKELWVSLRVTSRGNAIVHEMKNPAMPDDVNHDDPITMLYLDGDKLYLTHYCDAGNRPRMVAKTSPDGKTVEFDFVDLTGSTQMGHMYHAVFTVIDANHHTEDWTYMMPGDKPVHAHFDLQRVSQPQPASGKD
jgi:hypothetical protein